MEKVRYFVSYSHWVSLLSDWIQNEIVWAPISTSGMLHYKPVSPENISSIIYEGARAIEPLKWFLFPPIEKMNGRNQRKGKSWIVLAVKACDLQALRVLDSAFGGVFADPHYWFHREDTLLVATDCTSPLPTCFCTEVGGNPFPSQLFDLALSEIPNGFLVEIGTEKGEKKLSPFRAFLETPSREALQQVEGNRKNVMKILRRQNRKFKIHENLGEILYSQWNVSLWHEGSLHCVECGMCNHACPTCHCYFLDEVTREKYIKLRGWDACMYQGYAVMAGGTTPRPYLHQRFRNRYLCKFKYLKENYGVLGCTGCGRCIEGCQGKIEMRKLLSEFSELLSVHQKVALEKI